jgi:uncharacterized protein
MHMRGASFLLIVAALAVCHALTALAAPDQAELAPPTADQTDAFPERQAGASGVPAPAGATKLDVRDGGLYAELYLPEHTGRLPALIAIGGSEGGLEAASRTSVSFVQAGYAVLALAYWREPGLPSTLEGVPLEYFHAAISWLEQRPEVDPRRLGLIGGSRGGEAALLIASREPDIRAVVAVSPSSYVWPGWNFGRLARPAWTVSGRPVPYVPRPVEADFRARGALLTRADSYLARGRQHPEALIPVERISGPILLISGSDDHVWPSKEMAEMIMARLKKAGFNHTYRHLSYDGAGHLVFIGDPSSLTPESAQRLVIARFGGNLAAATAAWNDDWVKVVQFLAESLAQ